MCIRDSLKAWGHEVTDMGTMTKNSCDYSDYANEVASSIAAVSYTHLDVYKRQA